ncbi:MAG: lipopolysaccharide biosynthesis protein [Sphingobacteriales bacterium 17-39-43]|uniref:GumC family protein n=1 Tax=Daejeonella sp. TaxID=2805397 RepID=UPI000BC37483|nr:lipopolysaccharide biosynthesis protein [Daejeonella sp.]OYZ30882.1 MAG: lipopolysaccharide biosynthesis protein [Sphingobacteriales bacterium 16-39-50]OZA23668.1 MAG: lipopolysaccharide biosynthesis protein [Sphingobacteriales bacterium 17-39-43]HQT23466.1 lipopolysaccharide biosynthesis protein [Daejeonella sp.]HQT58343.1 lipopolysaccharide biosynthesis protein [Daejeonella sp.]
MEELKKFIDLLLRYKIVLITVPLITVMVTFYIVRNLPDVYPAQAQIATGIVDETQQMALSEASVLQESRINQKFINMVQVMNSKSMIDLVSYKLIIHDLSSKPFREPSELLKTLNLEAKKHALSVFKEKYNKKEGLNLRNDDENGLHRILGSMGYDYMSLMDDMLIYRAGTTDFIFIDFQSENSELSAFVVNTLSNEFTDYYTVLVKENQRSSVNFLKNLLKIKSDTLQARISGLREYKIENRILNLDEQSSQIYTQTADYELRIQQAEKDIVALKGTIANIDKRFDPADRRYMESTFTDINQKIIGSKALMNALQDKYIQSDFDERYKNSIDSLQRIVSAQINSMSDKYTDNPLSSKTALIQKKLDLQIELDRTVYGLNSLKNQLAVMSKKFEQLVPHEAVIQSYERDIQTGSEEYQDLLAQYNKVTMEAEFPVKLRQAQVAMPGLPLPSKKMLLVIISGMLSGVFCVIILFVMFFLDNRIRRPADLVLLTKAPVLGYLNLVGKSTLDLKGIWKNLHGTAEMREFKKQLRSTRFEVNRELARTSDRGQVLSITSISEGEGKTLISACIAYTYVMVNKKVLLIDGNFDNPSITKNSNTKLFLEDFLHSGDLGGINFNSGIMVMGNRGGDKSLLEVCDEETIMERLEQLRSHFDVILVETPPLDALNKAKEWILFTDKTLSVFEADQTLNEVKNQHINYLTTLNGQFIGWILNKVKQQGKPEERIDHANVLE